MTGASEINLPKLLLEFLSVLLGVLLACTADSMDYLSAQHAIPEGQ